MPDLIDASVWLPLSAPDHVHHERALQYWTDESADDVLFCRMTALALLRLLTNGHVMGKSVLDGATAWAALQTWLRTAGVGFVSEPTAIDEFLAAWSDKLKIAGARWTDAYLAAFAVAGGFRLVSFDGDFAQYQLVDFLHLES